MKNYALLTKDQLVDLLSEYTSLYTKVFNEPGNQEFLSYKEEIDSIVHEINRRGSLESEDNTGTIQAAV